MARNRINAGKMLLGGVAAGLVLAAASYASDQFIMAKDWQTVAQLRNIDPLEMGSQSALILSIAVNVLSGFLIVFVYAAIRPRFGPGPGTAIIAAFVVFLASALVMATMAGIFFSRDLYIRSEAVTLVAMLAAGLAGGWVYGEEERES